MAPPPLGKLSEGNDAEPGAVSGGLTEMSFPDFPAGAWFLSTESMFEGIVFPPGSPKCRCRSGRKVRLA
jgi:hypothetical protein